MKNNQSIRDVYLTSIAYGYLGVFLFVTPIVGVVLGGEVGVGNIFSIFMFSLILGIPAMILAWLIGLPIFKLLFKRIKAEYLIKVLTSGVGSAVACAVFVVIIVMIYQGSDVDLGFGLYILAPAILSVAVLSSVIYWWRTK